MKVSTRRGIVLLMMISAVPFLFAQTPALNPTVTVLPQATGPVPPECDGAPAPQIARTPLADRPPEPQPVAVAAAPAAPAADLPSELRAAHAAALSRDREGFTAATARARAMLASSSGTERAGAAGVIAVLDDVARLWDYQFATPSGSFFDASVQDGSLLRTLTKYPGYESFIQRQTIAGASGARYYPTRESIEFLLGVASERMPRAGVRVATQAPLSSTRPPGDRQPPRSQAVAEPHPSAPRAPSGPGATRAVEQPVQRRARTTPDRRAPARRTPAPPPVPAVPGGTSSAADEPPMPAGVVSALAQDTATAAPVATATAGETSGDIPLATDTVTMQTTDTGLAGEVQKPMRGRSIILPLVLILIGVGVLIVLFRASS